MTMTILYLIIKSLTLCNYASQDDRDSLWNKHTAMTPSSRQASLLSSYELNLTTNITYDLDY